MAHGLVITASAARSPMPMMTAAPAFPARRYGSSATPPPPGCTPTLTFTAATPGTYQYLCPVPGHAEKGMAGAFTIR